MIDLYYAEDDETIAQLVKEYLEQAECQVTVFHMIEDMKQALRKRQPDIILLDWNMPDGQGNDLCRWLRLRWLQACDLPDCPRGFLRYRRWISKWR